MNHSKGSLPLSDMKLQGKVNKNFTMTRSKNLRIICDRTMSLAIFHPQMEGKKLFEGCPHQPPKVSSQGPRRHLQTPSEANGHPLGPAPCSSMWGRPQKASVRPKRCLQTRDRAFNRRELQNVGYRQLANNLGTIVCLSQLTTEGIFMKSHTKNMYFFKNQLYY